MKKNKRLNPNAVAGTVLATLVINSCTEEYNLKDNIYGEFAE